MREKVRAVIDIGTNSVRLMVLAESGDTVRVLGRMIKVTSLGKGLSERNILLPPAMERTIETLEEMLLYAEELNTHNVTAVATSAVREAENGVYFADEIERRTGLIVTVISGSREAFLSHRGAAVSLGIAPDELVVFDIGGGSTEIVQKKSNTLSTNSYAVGVVKLKERFKIAESCDSSKVKEIEDYLKEVFYDLLALYDHQQLAGVGGTVTSLAAIEKRLKDYSPRIIHETKLSRSQVSALKNYLTNTTLKQRQNIPGLMPERADVIVAGVILTDFLLSSLGAGSFIVSEGDLMLGLMASPKSKIIFGND